MGFTLNKDPDVDSATATIAVSLLDALEQVQKQLGHFLHLLVSSAYVAAEERYHWYRKKTAKHTTPDIKQCKTSFPEQFTPLTPE